jgi:hypothetical protein
MQEAAASGKIFHLWWHPHNFGLNTELNLSGLRYLLTVFAECRDRFEFRSLSMADVASEAQNHAKVHETTSNSAATNVHSYI